MADAGARTRPRILPESAVINPAILERLRALGYVGK
jgi:hypothetical protein